MHDYSFIGLLFWLQNRPLRRLFDFICDSFKTYARTQINSVDSFQGQELMFGCLCFQVLQDVTANEEYMIAHSVPNLLLEGMQKQENAQVISLTAILNF